MHSVCAFIHLHVHLSLNKSVEQLLYQGTVLGSTEDTQVSVTQLLVEEDTHV